MQKDPKSLQQFLINRGRILIRSFLYGTRPENFGGVSTRWVLSQSQIRLDRFLNHGAILCIRKEKNTRSYENKVATKSPLQHSFKTKWHHGTLVTIILRCLCIYTEHILARSNSWLSLSCLILTRHSPCPCKLNFEQWEIPDYQDWRCHLQFQCNNCQKFPWPLG